MKRRGFFGALAAFCVAPFAVRPKVKVKHVDKGVNVIAFSKRRPDWRPPVTYKGREIVWVPYLHHDPQATQTRD